MFKNLIASLFIIFFYQNLFSKPLEVSGLKKLNLADIQTITKVDVYKNDVQLHEIEKIINDLYKSDLIYNIIFKDFEDDYYLIEIQENKIIQNIFFSNNIWLKDDILIEIIKSKKNNFLSKNLISQDISIINSLYRSRGFDNVSTIVKIEKFSDDKINLIFDIYEGKQSRLNLINFFGNKTFSDKFLSNQISSQALSFYNIFKSGSNLNTEIFNFDLNKIINFYKDNGFLDVRVSYTLDTNSFGLYSLNFFIEEGIKYKIDSIEYGQEIKNNNFFKGLNKNFSKNLIKNQNFYNKKLLDEYLKEINRSLLFDNINTYYVDYTIEKNNGYLNLNFIEKSQSPKIINKIDIYGNAITKENTIRSKLIIEPGDYYNKYLVDSSLSNLNKFTYIKNTNIEFEDINEKTNISLTIDEDKKTGNILLAGTYDTDTNLGIMFGIEDKNIAGTGNILDANFKVNSENLKYDLNYTQFPLGNPFLSNTYTVYNQENDYSSSFGYKALKQGIGYSLNFIDNSQVSYGGGVSYEYTKGHSAKNSNQASITDNIGDFENVVFKFNITKDTTNDIFNPSNGHYNNLNFILSPTKISDDQYIKIIFSNKNYFNLKNSNNFIFFNNKLGYAESLKSKLKTINAFSLGGSNFKGFDFRGIGPTSGDIYLGGNQFFTSTIGYGSSFLFDEKDNVNIKLFLSAGSIGKSDYTVNNDFDLRTSAGISLDFITAIGPISFTYATPLSKEISDKERLFTFSIGTSF